MRYITRNFSQENVCAADAYDGRPGLPRITASPQYATFLRKELSARNIKWAKDNGFLHEQTIGSSPSVIYRPDDQGKHGNFHLSSYKHILKNPQWRRRLTKKHTTALKGLLSHDPDRLELDSCNSSDALLMNIFCHPSVSSAQSALKSYLAVESTADFVFGYKPRVPFKNGKFDCTEVDLRIGDLMIEAKLTESGFQSARWDLVERYRDFEDVFDPELLSRFGDRLRSYQLLRGILAAFAEDSTRYCLVCDERRTDLIEMWGHVVHAVRTHYQRHRCVLVTWQEISQALPRSLQVWLQNKYGIIPSKITKG